VSGVNCNGRGNTLELVLINRRRRDYGVQLDGKWILPSLWLGLWNFISPGCAMPGALIAGFVHDRFGRRASLVVGSVLSAIGVAITYASYASTDVNVRRGVFLAGKGFQGMAIGMVVTTVQTYMSEILPPSLRGPILAFFPVFTLLGQLIGAIVIFVCLNVERGYSIAIATQWPFSMAPMIIAFLVPESPTYLVRRNRFVDALGAQRRLDMPGADSELTIKILRRNIERETALTKATYIDSFRSTNLRRILIVLFASSLPQLFGLMLLAKSSYFLQVCGLSPNNSVLMLIMGIVLGLLANLVSIWVLSKLGRRRLIISTLGAATFVWIGMGVAGFFTTPGSVWYVSHKV
jgi:MFS family permease